MHLTTLPFTTLPSPRDKSYTMPFKDIWWDGWGPIETSIRPYALVRETRGMT